MKKRPKNNVPPGHRVRVGDTVSRRPTIFSDSEGIGLLKGTVIYVHPKGRFHVVEFTGKIGTIREAFFGVRR